MSMNRTRGLHHISAQALVPEQLLNYVAAVGGSKPVLFGDCVGHVYENSVVLVGYPLHGTAVTSSAQSAAHLQAPKAADIAALDEALRQVLSNPRFTRISVLGPVRPSAAPADAGSSYDTYWSLPLPPPPPRQKLRNMLSRARRDVYLDMAPSWTEQHEALVDLYCRSRPLEAGTRHIFQHLGDYVHGLDRPGTTHLGEVQVFSAYSQADNSLLACALADYSSLRTAFYMFAFRQPKAPPGSSDLLLQALCAEGLARGHSVLNLGLGITPGISFFKKKWQAEAFLPYVETSWEVRPARHLWWSRLFPERLSGKKDTVSNSPALASADPLANPAFKSAGLGECLQELLGNAPQKELDCIQVEVTSKCAGLCSYCPHTTKAAQWRSRSMEASTFAALWPLLRTTTRVHLQGWGEPLLHPRFFDFAALARKAGCQVSTTSCGLHMNENIAEKIVRSGMDIVAFSLAGTDAASNASRAGVPFEAVCEAITCLQKVRKKRMGAHLEIHLAYLMLTDSMDAVLRLPELMGELGIHVAVVSTLDYLAAPEHAAWAFAPHEADKIAKARSLLHKVSAQAASLERTIYYALPNPVPSAECRENIRRNMYVDADGNCAPCIYLNLPTSEHDAARRMFGNLNSQTALELWNQADFASFRQSLVEQRPEGACLHCPKRFDKDL